MIAVKINRPYSEAPQWWRNFTQANKYPTTIDKNTHKDYVNYINGLLIPQGGRLHWNYISSQMLLTFRIDANYTMFLMRWA